MKTLRAFFLLIILFGGFPIALLAKSDLSRCVVTIKRVEVKKESGQWFVIASPDKLVDVVNEELAVSFFNQGKIPDGAYTNFKVVLSETIKVSGHDGNNFTKEGGEVILGGTAKTAADLPGRMTSFKEISPTWDDKTQGEITVGLNLDNEDPDDEMEFSKDRDFITVLNIKKGSFIRIWIDIGNLSGSLYCASPNAMAFESPPVSKKGMYFLPPGSMAGAGIVVDNDTRQIRGEDIRMEF